MYEVTTRSQKDVFENPHAFCADDLAKRSFNDNIAHVLNGLYGTDLTGREVELVIGKRSAGLLHLDSRTLVAEIWKDADGSFSNTVRRLYYLTVNDPEGEPGPWFTMSVRISMLFGVFGELMAGGVETPLDLAVPSMDFMLPLAAWYARSWGLPIGTIICACNENNAPWSLLHQGELRADAVIRTMTPGCDQAVPAGLEELIQATLGVDEAARYRSALDGGRLYKLEAVQKDQLRAGISVSVISKWRTEFMIPNIYRSGRWQPDLYSAMAWAALEDHRARAGETGKALILAEEDPVCCAETLARILTMPADHLRRKLQRK